MKLITSLLLFATIAVLGSGCSAQSTPIPTATVSWDEHSVATVRAVIAATVFAPTHTSTPTLTPTNTPTPSPTRTVPYLSPTPAVSSCIPEGAQVQTGKVVKIIDGRTLLVDIDGKEYKVRYLGINVPEDALSKKLIDAKTTSINQELVEGRTIRMFKDTTDADVFGRLPRYVFAGKIFINYELVRLGLATAVADPPDTACFDIIHEAEHEASVKLAGLWSMPSPTKTPLGFGLEKITEVPCDCYGEELDCIDFDNQMAAQSCYNYCKSLGLGDVFDLAVGSNGRACTGLP